MLASRANIFEQMLDWPDWRAEVHAKFFALLENDVFKCQNSSKSTNRLRIMCRQVFFHSGFLIGSIKRVNNKIWLVRNIKKAPTLNIDFFSLKEYSAFYYPFLSQKFSKNYGIQLPCFGILVERLRVWSIPSKPVGFYASDPMNRRLKWTTLVWMFI